MIALNAFQKSQAATLNELRLKGPIFRNVNAGLKHQSLLKVSADRANLFGPAGSDRQFTAITPEILVACGIHPLLSDVDGYRSKAITPIPKKWASY
ncbi:MAG: hypothetical protein WCJ09_05765 [Planctomycetota bacterium]